MKRWMMVWLMFLFPGVAILFWYNEWIYRLPTPVPLNYKRVSQGKVIQFNNFPEMGQVKRCI